MDSIDPTLLQDLLSGDDALMRATLDSAPDGVVVYDRDGRILSLNQRFQDLWQFPADLLARRDAEPMQQHVAARLVDPQAYWRTLGLQRSGEISRRFETLALLDGRQFERHVARLRALPRVPNAEGGAIVWWRDVTQRHQTHERQRQLLTLLELALTSANLAYWDVDVQSGQVRSHNDRWHSILGYSPGDLNDNYNAWDALVHPDDAALRQAAWQAHIEGRTPRYEAEFRMRHKSGHWVWLQARGQAVTRGPDGRALRLVGTREDITLAKQAQQGLMALAHTDELTGVDNRRRFLQRAEEELGRARRYGLPVVLLMMDLDHFKAINDTVGHAGGDLVLGSFANTARAVMRQSDLFARIGGEEFAALLPHTSLEGALVIAERLLDQVRQRPAPWQAGAVPYTVSVGLSLAVEGQSLQQLMVAADRALYLAKSQGRDRLVVA